MALFNAVYRRHKTALVTGVSETGSVTQGRVEGVNFPLPHLDESLPGGLRLRYHIDNGLLVATIDPDIPLPDRRHLAAWAVAVAVAAAMVAVNWARYGELWTDLRELFAGAKQA
jgi:hypothetical protein